MAKFTKGMLISSLIIFVAGLALIIYASVRGGVNEVWSLSAKRVMEVPFIKNSTFGVRMLEDGDFSIGLWSDDSDYISGSGEIVTVESDVKVTSVSVDVDFGDVLIETTTDTKPSYSFKGKVGNIEAFVNDEGTFVFKTKMKKTVMNFSAGNIVLYIPENINKDKLDIRMGAGSFEVKELTGYKEVNIDVGAGECSIDKLVVDKIDINCAAGDIEINEAKINKIDIDCACGNLDLVLDGDADDYNYNLSAAMGNIELGSKSYTGIDKKVDKDNGSDKTVAVDCALGNIEIDFE